MKQKSRGTRGGLWMVAVGVAAVLTLRLVASLSLAESPLLMHPVLQDADYQARTLRLAEGMPAPEGLPRGSILYPALAQLAPGLREGGVAPLAVLQSVFEAATALLLLLWIRRRWSNRAALAAGILYALDPLGAFFAARFSPVTPATLLFIGSLWIWDAVEREPRSGGHQRARTGRQALGATIRPFLLGLAATAGFLLMPLPFLFLLLIHLWTAARRRAWSSVILALFPFVVVVGLALARNAGMRDGEPILAWGGGPALASAFDPATGGTPRGLEPPAWLRESGLRARAWEALGREGSDGDLFRYYAGLGLRRAAESPVRTLGVLLTKAAATVGAYPIPDDLSPVFVARRDAPLFAYLVFSFAGLFGLGLAGIVSLRGDPTRRNLVTGLLCVGLGALLGTASAAARQPALPLLAALGGVWIAGSAAGPLRRRAPVAALVGGIAVSLVAGHLSPTAALLRPSEDLRLLAETFTQSTRQRIAILEEAVRLQPSNLDARVALASAYQTDGLVSAATEQLREAYAADSTHTGTLLALATLSQNRGDRQAAEAYLRRLAASHPNNPLYLNQLGQLRALAGDMAEATILFTRALRLKPDYDVAQQNLQGVEMYRQRLEESLFPPEMRLAEDDPLQQVQIDITTAMDQEEWTRADSLIAHIEESRPDLMQPSWFRAAYCARQGDLDGAVAALNEARRRAPGRPIVAQRLAEIYIASGRIDAVEPMLKEEIGAAEGDSVRVAAMTRLLDSFQEQRRQGGR